MDCSPTLGVTALVGLPSTDACRRSSSDQETGPCPRTPNVNGSTSNHETHKTGGLSSLRKQLRERGISEEGTDIIMASWKPGTKKQYRPHINRWKTFCCRRNLNPLNPSVTDIINFLSETFHRGVGFESINTARGALSALGVVVEGFRAGSHPLVSRFLRGAFNLRPTKPRYTEIWDVKPVLQEIRHMDPLHSLSLKDLTLKLVMLMALTQAARVQTLHLLMIKGISLGEESISVYLGDNIKQCRPKFNIQVVQFKAYSQDPRLCVVTTLKAYIERTDKLRKEFGNDKGKLLISCIKPHKYVSKDTVARWLKVMLRRCGIDTTKYTAGSVRPASTSKAKALAVPITTIMAKAGWTQETTFARHYNKLIEQDTDSFQQAILGSV